VMRNPTSGGLTPSRYRSRLEGSSRASGSPYSIIYADPPWSYRDKAHAGQRGVDYKYGTLTPEQIARLNVASIAAEDAVLFLWITPPQLEVGLEIIETWGFAFKTLAFTWVKTYPKAGTPCVGMGHWTRSNAELVLLGVRGKPKRVDAGVRQVIIAPRGEHSAKPPEVRDRIVQLMGDLPRIELFARENVEGWHAWGNEVECDVDLIVPHDDGDDNDD